MIPFIRSLTELMVITQPKNQYNTPNGNKSLEGLAEVSLKNDKYINSKIKNKIGLPEFPKTKIRRWVKSKEAVSKFLNELDYNNQIQSSYDLTLLDIQNNFDEHNVA